MTQLWCYRLDYRDAVEEESVWSLVQTHGGYMSIGPTWIDFYVDPKYAMLMNIAFPMLIRQPRLDYV